MSSLPFASATEATDFQVEFARLDPMRHAFGERPRHLLTSYRRLVAELTPFATQLREATPAEKREPLLRPWLEQWFDEGRYHDALFEVQLYLDARGAGLELLKASFHHPPTLLSPTQLGILRAAPNAALAQWFDLAQKARGKLSDQQLSLACTILLESLFHDNGEQGTTEEFLSFVETLLPALQAIFPGCTDTDRFADWFKLWLDHARKAVPNLPAQHAYYELEFTTILKYVPPAIWWNNGLPYRNGDKAFHYYSDEFFWLATGGSLRKMPNHPPYSKRMAKEFIALPPELRHGDNDTYTYCFLLSLGCLHEMAMALQRYFQRPEGLGDLLTWKEQLDPIVQTLRNYNIDWQDNAANFLLGYIYHLFRDQPDFSISGRAEEHLLRDAEAYYDRIEARRAEQARRNAEREAARRREENRDYWKPLSGVNAWEEVFGRYDRVRKRQIVELTTQGAITAESASMKHCVSTYFRACKNGASSIWSLRELRQNGSWYSVLTLEIRPNLRSIVQIRGRFNARPGKEQMEVIKQWAEREGLSVLET